LSNKYLQLLAPHVIIVVEMARTNTKLSTTDWAIFSLMINDKKGDRAIARALGVSDYIVMMRRRELNIPLWHKRKGNRKYYVPGAPNRMSAQDIVFKLLGDRVNKRGDVYYLDGRPSSMKQICQLTERTFSIKLPLNPWTNPI